MPPAPAAPDAGPPATDATPKADKPKGPPGWAEVPAAPPRSAGPDAHPPAEPTPEVTVDDRREAPDFDGRDDVVTAGDVALWVPRVAFFPVYLLTEYVVRRPLGSFVMWVEQGDVIGTLEELFTFGPNNNIGVVPTGFLDFGFRPSIGIYAFWNQFLDDDNAIRLNLATGGERWYKGVLADRIELGGNSYLQLEVDGLQRPDLLFWGVGPRSLDQDEGAYELRTVGGGARVRLDLGRKGNFFESWLLARGNAFGNGDCGGSIEADVGGAPAFACGSATIFEKVQAGRYDLPAGFDGYSTIKTGGRLILDSRDPRPAPGTGIGIDLMGEHVGEVGGDETGAWVNWGATAAGFVDLTGTQRVLSLSLTARFADPLDGDYEIPFIELVGGRRSFDVPEGELLHGFRPGRLVGRSAAAAALEYRWPVWAFLDGVMQAGVGNVFSEHLEDFQPQLMRFSFTGGLRSSNHRDHSFNLLLGFGTETFEQGGDLTSVRFLFGGTTGF